jgi:uncharacterized membrane protein YsdA (DUF1294 family)
LSTIDFTSPPVLVASVYAMASAATFLVYGLDKGLATRGARRVPERTLHLLELLGGWPGALVGMRTFRHKSQKTSFRVVTYAIVLLHAGAWAAYLAR